MFMKNHSQEFPVEKMAKVLEVSRSGYYKYLNKQDSKRAIDDRSLLEKINMIYKQNRYIYGSPRIHRALKKAGHAVSRKRVARLMQKHSIQSKIRKKWKPITRTNKEQPFIAPNLLKQNFVVHAQNIAWVSDITYVHTHEGWLYVAAILDLYSRKIVGLSMGSSPDTALVLKALQQAVCHRQAKPGLILHSDRGCQYTSFAYRDFLRKCGIVQSMSAKGNCYDNAPMESFFHTLKTEHIFFCNYRTREQAMRSIFEYVEVFYNRQRIHSTIGYCSPVEFELQHMSRMKLARPAMEAI